MIIIKNPNEEMFETATEAVRANGGYCPCALEKKPETLCMCQAFLNQGLGECSCGRYIKVEE